MKQNQNSEIFLRWKECVLENPRSFYGCATLGPFQRSQSLTVANALRRTLLSQRKGIAITHVQIDGAIHEYTTLKGVRESIIDILLNLKHIVLKGDRLKQPFTAYIQARGPGIVRAIDLKLPRGIRCVDPDQYIATLTEDGVLSMKCTIADDTTMIETQSFGQNQNLWVDPVFNPILKVNYVIEPIEPAQTAYPEELVHIEMWTNGSMSPQKALHEAFVELQNMFSKIEASRSHSTAMMRMINESEKSQTYMLKAFEHARLTKDDYVKNRDVWSSLSIFSKNNESIDHKSIDILNLPLRVKKTLVRNNICSIHDLLTSGPHSLKKIPGIGNGSILIIQKHLKMALKY